MNTPNTLATTAAASHLVSELSLRGRFRRIEFELNIQFQLQARRSWSSHWKLAHWCLWSGSFSSYSVTFAEASRFQTHVALNWATRSWSELEGRYTQEQEQVSAEL